MIDPLLKGFLAECLHELIRVLIRLHIDDTASQPGIPQNPYAAQRRLDSCTIAVIGEQDIPRISAEQVCLLWRERCSQRRNRLCEARLMHGNDIHIALTDDNIPASRRPREIQSVQVPTLVKYRCLRGIQILWLSIPHNSAAKADHSIVNILNGVHYPVPELAQQSVLLRVICKPRLLDQFILKALASEILHQFGTVLSGIAESEMMHRLVRQFPLLQILIADGSVRRAQLVIEELRRFLVDLEQPCTLSRLPLLLLGVFHLRQLYSRALREKLHRLRKGIVLIFHHKGIDISADTAAEAMIHLLAARHREGRCLLPVKGTACPVIATLFLQPDISGHHIHYIVFRPDLLN